MSKTAKSPLGQLSSSRLPFGAKTLSELLPRARRKYAPLMDCDPHELQLRVLPGGIPQVVMLIPVLPEGALRRGADGVVVVAESQSLADLVS